MEARRDERIGYYVVNQTWVFSFSAVIEGSNLYIRLLPEQVTQSNCLHSCPELNRLFTFRPHQVGQERLRDGPRADDVDVELSLDHLSRQPDGVAEDER